MALPSSKNRWHNQCLLITGGAGYLAINLARLLRDTACHIIRLHRRGGTSPMAFPDATAKIEDVQGDVRDRQMWSDILEGVDFVFHFAAQTSVYVANQDPLADLDMNVLPMLHLLETCRQKRWTPVVLFAGTVTEAGIPIKLPVDETHPDNPVTIYDLHKLMAERYLKYYSGQGIVCGAALRLANVYGPGPRSSSADRGVLNGMIRKAISGETLTVYGAGSYMRDYVYVEDVARAFLEAAAKIGSVNGQHFVIGSGQGYTIAEAINLVAERVALKTGKRVRVIHVDPPKSLSAIERRNFIADASRFTVATGWQPRMSLVDGIDQTIAVYLSEKDDS